MRFRGNNKVVRPPFEFQRNGPVVKGPAGHKPDFTLAITRPSQANKVRAMTSHTPRKTKLITLDTVFLIDSIKNSNYKKCKEIDISSRKLGKVDLNALRELHNLKKIDCGDNCLTLEPFVVVPNLEELDISCNGIRRFDFSESESLIETGLEAWRSMKKLNLGFNSCSNFITDIMLMPNLSWLNLSHNNISKLPPNMMHFTNLKYLDLSSNYLNSETAFFALATVPSLETLILDKNQIEQIPSFDFGFESLKSLSLQNNDILSTDDLVVATSIDSLEEINIMGNPICMKLKEIPYVKQLFQDANIKLIMNEIKKQKKSVLPSKLRTVAYDPLCLPSFTKQHIQALNKKTPRKMVDQNDLEEEEDNDEFHVNSNKTRNDEKVVDNVFMTDVGNVAREEEDEPKPSDIPETPLPDEFNEDDINIKTSVWDEVPVVQQESRKQLSSKTKTQFDYAFKKLVFIVTHPDLRIKPRESPSSEPQQEGTSKAPIINLITKPTPNMQVASRKKKNVASQLQARTEYTKTEIQQMLRSMEERLSVVESDLIKVDETGQAAVEVALDQQNFTNLHKQYETIRAELLNTLNS